MISLFLRGAIEPSFGMCCRTYAHTRKQLVSFDELMKQGANKMQGQRHDKNLGKNVMHLARTILPKIMRKYATGIAKDNTEQARLQPQNNTAHDHTQHTNPQYGMGDHSQCIKQAIASFGTLRLWRQ
jgi:hypothetical protein